MRVTLIPPPLASQGLRQHASCPLAPAAEQRPPHQDAAVFLSWGPWASALRFFLKHIMTVVLTRNSQTCGSPVAVCRPVVVSGFAETCSHQHGQV